MQPLVDEMTRQEPGDRPTIEQAMRHFEQLLGSLSQWRLRSRYVYRDEFLLARPFHLVRHIYRTVRWILRKTPAIPTYEVRSAVV